MKGVVFINCAGFYFLLSYKQHFQVLSIYCVPLDVLSPQTPQLQCKALKNPILSQSYVVVI